MAKVYLRNKDLLAEIIKSKEQDKLTPEAVQMLILLSERAIRKLRYRNPKKYSGTIRISGASDDGGIYSI